MKKYLILLVVAAVAFTGCNQSSKKKSGSTGSDISLTAAGATFPMPFYNQIFSEYQKETGVQITYGGIGSGGGIRSLKDKVVDFGATDAYLSDEQEAEMPAPIVHMPTCMGAVVIAYNLPGIDSIKLDSTLMEGIFMGKITKWNDPLLQAYNPGIDLPDMDISVVHRSDGSGTTFIFSDYMSNVSPAWNEQIGRGKSLNWPVGMGAKGNPGVAGTVGQTVGSIGYIGSEYAFAQDISFAELKNSSGKYIKPTVESISAAAKGEIPADTRIMLTNSNDPEAYPISGFTWIILYKEQNYNGRSKEQALATLKLLDWILSPDAQQVTKKIHYSPLPQKAVEQAKNNLKSVTYNGEPLL